MEPTWNETSQEKYSEWVLHQGEPSSQFAQQLHKPRNHIPAVAISLVPLTLVIRFGHFVCLK